MINVGAFASCHQIEDIFFEGTKKQWESISIQEDNGSIKEAVVHYV